MPLHKDVGSKQSVGRRLARVRGGVRAWGVGRGVQRGVARPGEGHWGGPGIVMQIVLGEANVSLEHVLFLAMIRRELQGNEGEGKGGRKERRPSCTTWIRITVLTGIGR